MRNNLFAIVVLSLLTACSSPVLKWIDTPGEGEAGRISGQLADKEITQFSFDIKGESVIIGGEPQLDGKYPILAIVPLDSSSVSLSARRPTIAYKGVSISPEPTTSLDFDKPVTYTVTAEDHTTRDYEVQVLLNETPDDAKQITGFYFADPLVEGVIDQVAKTIVLTVPAGTALGALRPELYYIGESISPQGGQPRDFANPVVYTVHARNGTTQPYTVSVSTLALPAPPRIDISGSDGTEVAVGTETADADADGFYTILVELPTYIINPAINISYEESADGGGTQSQPINNVYNTFKAGDHNEYTLVVINPPPDTPSAAPPPPPPTTASIDGFYFANPVAVGEIGTGAGTAADPIPITVKVPYGTDLRNLAASICFTGKEIAGIPGPNPLKAGARSFVNPVDYTVIAEDGASSTTYRATLVPARNGAKAITAFSFDGVAPTSALISAVPTAADAYLVVVTLPPGQSFANLTPVITHTGASITGAGIPAGGPGTVTAASKVTTFSQTTPVNYTVTAEDGSARTYAVTVRNETTGEGNLEITGFYFTEPLAVGAINQDANTITVRVPSSVATTSLKPTVYFRGMSLKPGPGAVNNFSGPVTYTVTGNSGKTRSYTVSVLSTPSSAKDITRFAFPDTPGAETIIGSVPNPYGTYPISIWVPPGTDLHNLTPDIDNTGVTVTPGPGAPASGSPGDFSGPLAYTVTAEDGGGKTYTVTVNTQSRDAKVITSLIFGEVPLAGGGVVRVVASIDQIAHAITAEVPFAADIGALKPTLTYIGRTIAGPLGADQTANPYTDTPRNFSGPQTYTVKDQSGAGQPYTVTVIRKSSVGVSFTGDLENTIIASSNFDQNTGVITVTVDTAAAAAPYEWYLDGVKQPVSNAAATFTLKVGDGTLIPGRHEILVSGRKNGLHYTGKVSFTLAGGS
jgi:hypothetical protein